MPHAPRATLLTLTLAAAATLTVPAAAHADSAFTPADVDTAISARRTAIGVNVGIGSAVGEAGLTLTEAFGQHVRVEAGLGVGLSGMQVSLMPKLVLGNPRFHFVAGVGLSVAYPSSDTRTADGHPVWLNADILGYELRFRNGLAISAAVGFTGGLGGGRVCFPPDGCEPQFLDPVTKYWWPQGRAGMAYWF